jgi:hypothetical protein
MRFRAAQQAVAVFSLSNWLSCRLFALLQASNMSSNPCFMLRYAVAVAVVVVAAQRWLRAAQRTIGLLITKSSWLTTAAVFSPCSNYFSMFFNLCFMLR